MNTEETKILNGATAASGRMELQEGATLQSGKYKIEKVLGQGGFGITYLAEQTSLQKTVAIKEFFFKEYCVRCTDSSVALTNPNNSDMLNRFLMKFEKEARTISNLDNPNIISIHDTFKENGTAYYVMDYIEGESLEAMIKRVGALKGYKAIEYFKQIAGALSYIHKRKINHLDVKPANIMIRKSDDKAILIDFGLSKQYNARGGQTSTTPVGISHGYAPIEQYNPNGVETFSPQTDIYSLGATLFKMVTGTTPPSSLEISNNGFPSLKNIDQSTADIIKSCMAVKKADRVQNADLLLSGDNIIKAMWESSPDGKGYKRWCSKRLEDIVCGIFIGFGAIPGGCSFVIGILLDVFSKGKSDTGGLLLFVGPFWILLHAAVMYFTYQ
jgi:serine/threonine protein kinase